MNDSLYSVRVINGEVVDWAFDDTTESLKYEGLTWEESVELCRLSFENGFVCVIWRQYVEEPGGTDDGEKCE